MTTDPVFNVLNPVGLFNHLTSITPANRFLIAYSGGLDSHILLHLMSRISDFEVRAMHIHHGLLKEADDWVKHCETSCSSLNILLHTEYLDLEVASGDSVEEIARKGRYKALKAALEDDEVLLTAHHQNDQTETLFLQLFRGAGVNGLAAMPEMSTLSTKDNNKKLVRPLLSETRQALEAYAKKHGLKSIEDPSNADTSFDRNYLRHQVLPLLRKRWKGLDKAISRSASIQAETKKVLDQLAKEDLKASVSDDPLSIFINKLQELSIERQRLVLRYWIVQSGFLAPSEIKLKHLFSDVIFAREDARPLLEWKGAQIRRFQQKLYIMKPLSEHDSTQVLIWKLNQPLEIESLSMVLNFSDLNIEEKVLSNKHQSVTVRFRSGGERFYNAKSNKHISLKNLMQKAAVPPWVRSRMPLIYVGDDLIKIVGLDEYDLSDKH